MIVNDSFCRKIVKENSKIKGKVKRMLLAFFFGGIIAIVAQSIYDYFLSIKVESEVSTLLSSAFIILISFFLTCFGIFDKFVLIAYCGALIPISGFANSITSSALEGKSEGMIFGIGGKMFSLIGSVCTYGIVSSMFLGLIYFIMQVIK